MAVLGIENGSPIATVDSTDRIILELWRCDERSSWPFALSYRETKESLLVDDRREITFGLFWFPNITVTGVSSFGKADRETALWVLAKVDSISGAIRFLEGVRRLEFQTLLVSNGVVRETTLPACL